MHRIGINGGRGYTQEETELEKIRRLEGASLRGFRVFFQPNMWYYVGISGILCISDNDKRGDISCLV